MAKRYKKDFSPETWMRLSYKSVEAFKDLEDEILQYQFEMLNKGVEMPLDKWLELQMAQANLVNKGIIAIIKKGRPNVQELLKESFNSATDIAKEKLQEVNQTGQPINISNDEAVKTRLGLVDESFKMLALNHTRVTASLPAKIFANINSIPGHTTWTMEEHLKQFHKAIEYAYKKELPNMTSVTYANGRNVSFKSYVEMAVRTEINNVAVDMMQEGCKGIGVVLFLASSLSNSAPDHAPYQGKVYILKDWKSIVPSEYHEKYEKLIAKKDIKTLEWVKEEGTWTNDKGKTYKIALGVRPNCRHTFTPITYEQAVNSNQTLIDLGVKDTGNYDKDKYIQMQKQRELERKIREKKLEYDNKLTEVRTSKNEEEATRLLAEANTLKSDVKYYQKRMRWLIYGGDEVKSNGEVIHHQPHKYLQREYNRENPNRMVSNLGIKN